MSINPLKLNRDRQDAANLIYKLSVAFGKNLDDSWEGYCKLCNAGGYLIYGPNYRGDIPEGQR
jgi:hypothetical protein